METGSYTLVRNEDLTFHLTFNSDRGGITTWTLTPITEPGESTAYRMSDPINGGLTALLGG